MLAAVLAAALLLPVEAACPADGKAASQAVTVGASGSSSASSSGIPAPGGTGAAAQAADLPDAKPEGAAISQNEAIAKVRALFPELKEAQVRQASYGEQHTYPRHDRKIWDIEWNIQQGNSGYGFGSRVDARNGDLLNISLNYGWNSRQEVYYPPKVDREEALQLAKQFVAKASPSVGADQLEEQDIPYFSDPQNALFGPVRYQFRFLIKVNGIESGDTITLGMDGNGKVTDYYQTYAADTYPDSTPAFTAKQAEDRFREHFRMELSYYPVRENGRVTDWFLAWHPAEPQFNIGAATGQWIGPDGSDLDQPELTYADIPQSGGAFRPVPHDGSYLTAEQAAAAVKKFAAIPDGYKLDNKSLQNDYQTPEEKIWYLNWQDDRQIPFGQGLSAQVDASTGQILQFGRFQYGPIGQANDDGQDADPQAAITESQARDKALALVRELYPNAADELKLSSHNWPDSWISSGGEAYRFQFQRFYNGIAVNGENVSLSIDKQGNLSDYRAERTPNLPRKLKGLADDIGQSKAEQRYLDNSSMKLVYARYETYDGKPDSFVQSKIKLAYARVRNDDNSLPNPVIDARTGEWRSAWSSVGDAAQTVEMPSDIQGNWAKDALATLVKYRVLAPDASGNVHPDQTVSLGDWLNMMAIAVNPHYANRFGPDDSVAQSMRISKEDPYYDAVRFAGNMQWIDAASATKERLSAGLTREEMAKVITKLLRYDKLSGYLAEDLNYGDDDSIQAKGDVRIVSDLGLMTGSGGYFHPRRTVTRAEAAAIMMRLVRLQGKTDASLTSTP